MSFSSDFLVIVIIFLILIYIDCRYIWLLSNNSWTTVSSLLFILWVFHSYNSRHHLTFSLVSNYTRMFFVAWIYWTTFSICHLLNCFDTNRLENDRELKFRPRSAIWSYIESTLTACCGTRTSKQYMKQKEIMNMLFCIFLSICYYAIGIGYYRSVEQWSLIDCIYFITSTLLVSIVIFYWLVWYYILEIFIYLFVCLFVCLFVRYYYHRQSVTVTSPLLRIIREYFRPFISSAVLCWSVIHLYLFVVPGLQLMWIDSSTCLVRRKLSRFVLLILLLLLLLLFLS